MRSSSAEVILFCPEGQQVLRRLDIVPARKDVAPAIPRLLPGADEKPITFLSMDIEFAKKGNDLQGEFKKLFALK